MKNSKQSKKAELEFYDNQNISQDDLKQVNQQCNIVWKNVFDNFVDFNNNELTLDIGCQYGFYSSIIKKRGSEVVGADFSRRFIDIAKKSNEGIPFVSSDVNNLPFKSNAFDKIVCLNLLHHVVDLKNPIEELARVLKEGGTIAIADPNTSSPLRKSMNLIQRLFTKIGIFKFHPNEKPYPINSLTSLLKSNNFMISKTIYFFGSIYEPSQSIFNRIKWCIYYLNFKLFRNLLPSISTDDFLIVAIKQ